MKRRQFLNTLPVLASFPLVISAKSKGKTQEERHLIGLGTAASMLVNNYGSKLGFTSITLIDSFPIRNQKEIAYYIPFNFLLYQKAVHIKSSKSARTPTIPLDPIIKDHLENLTGDLVFVSGLGNEAGSLLSQSIGTQYFHETGNQKWIVTIPFQFEGKAKYERSYTILRNLMDYQDHLSFYYLDDIREKYGNLSIRSAFEKVDLEVLKLIELKL